MIRGFARSDIAANFLLIGILIPGEYSVIERVPMEEHPAWKFKQMNIDVPMDTSLAFDNLFTTAITLFLLSSASASVAAEDIQGLWRKARRGRSADCQDN